VSAPVGIDNMWNALLKSFNRIVFLITSSTGNMAFQNQKPSGFYEEINGVYYRIKSPGALIRIIEELKEHKNYEQRYHFKNYRSRPCRSS
jgi:maltoporin